MPSVKKKDLYCTYTSVHTFWTAMGELEGLFLLGLHPCKISATTKLTMDSNCCSSMTYINVPSSFYPYFSSHRNTTTLILTYIHPILFTLLIYGYHQCATTPRANKYCRHVYARSLYDAAEYPLDQFGAKILAFAAVEAQFPLLSGALASSYGHTLGIAVIYYAQNRLDHYPRCSNTSARQTVHSLSSFVQLYS